GCRKADRFQSRQNSVVPAPSIRFPVSALRYRKPGSAENMDSTAYRAWQLAARHLLEPLAALMSPGRADIPIKGAASDHDAQADRLESFARPLTLAAFLL